MSDSSDDLEQLIRRPPLRDPLPSRTEHDGGALGRCPCGAQITNADVYGGGGHDLVAVVERAKAALRNLLTAKFGQ